MPSSKPYFGERVTFYTDKDNAPHVAFVIRLDDYNPQVASLVYYCPVAHAWQEATDVRRGELDTYYET